jgi:hypothetical protein
LWYVNKPLSYKRLIQTATLGGFLPAKDPVRNMALL